MDGFYFESNSMEFVGKIDELSIRLREITEQNHDDIYDVVLDTWFIEAPVYQGLYPYPNKFGSPRGQGGTIRSSVADYSIRDVNFDIKDGYYLVSEFVITGIDNEANWFSDYDYAKNFYFDGTHGNNSFFDIVYDTSYEYILSMQNSVYTYIARAFNHGEV